MTWDVGVEEEEEKVDFGSGTTGGERWEEGGEKRI
jgi:hypothetical protein